MPPPGPTGMSVSRPARLDIRSLTDDLLLELCALTARSTGASTAPRRRRRSRLVVAGAFRCASAECDDAVQTLELGGRQVGGCGR